MSDEKDEKNVSETCIPEHDLTPEEEDKLWNEYLTDFKDSQEKLQKLIKERNKLD